MVNDRKVIIGAVIAVVVVAAAYFMFTGEDATTPQPAQPAPAATQPKS
jgi:hypothetical protein